MIKVPKYTLVHVHRDNIIFLAILTAEGADMQLSLCWDSGTRGLGSGTREER